MLDHAPAFELQANTTEKLRVGVLGLGGLGGSGRVACDLARGLAKLGNEVALLTSSNPQFADEYGPQIRHIPVRAPREPQPAGPWVTELSTDVEDSVRTLGLRVLTVHYGVGLAEAAMMARDRLRSDGIHLAVAVTLHGSDVSQFGPESVQTETERLGRVLRAADVVTAVSANLAHQAQERFRLPQAPRIIVNGVDLDVFRPEGQPVNAAGGRLCHVSNFRPIKRPLDNVDVVEHLIRRGTEVTLTMIGDGPLRGQTEQRVQERGLEPFVRFVDPLPQVQLAEHLRQADLLLVTSQTESFGLAAVEALASGTPFVGTKCGGLEELLRGAESPDLAATLLVEPGDTLRLAQRVARLLADDDERNEVRRQGLLLGQAQFDRPRQLDAYADMLRRLQAEATS